VQGDNLSGVVDHTANGRIDLADAIYQLQMLAGYRDAGSTPLVDQPVYYYLNDHLGAPLKVLDQDQAVVWNAVRKPFGETAVLPGSTFANPFRFPGQFFDDETGMHYNYYRYYDPKTSRYISADPIGLDGGLNLYAYVGGDPVNWIDPLGLYTEVVQWGRSPGRAGRWGHISGNINDQNWSFGQGGWDTKYPNFSDYSKRQADPDIDRGGRGIVLNLSPAEEAQLRRCLQSYDDYHGLTNNCGNPWVQCLEKLGIVDSSDKARILPYDIYRIISASPRSSGSTNYPGTHKPVGAH
jgi:RHS repeat-associated protein